MTPAPDGPAGAPDTRSDTRSGTRSGSDSRTGSGSIARHDATGIPAGETPEARIARWTERDAAVGLEAELVQVRATVAGRDAQIATLRERCDQLANRVVQFEIERDALRHRVVAAERPPLGRRAYGRARRLAGRMLPR